MVVGMLIARDGTSLIMCSYSLYSKKGNKMSVNSGQISQLLNKIPFPIGKADLVRQARQMGANNQIISALERLPDKTFNSSQELQKELGNLGNLGGFKV